MKGQTDSGFRAWRMTLGLTQKGAASSLGYCRAQIQKYDQGKKIPDRALQLAMLALSMLSEGKHDEIRTTTFD
jgi:hypothetical protein